MMNRQLIDEDSEVIANSDIDWGVLKNKTILVSGATGYVTQFLIQAMLKKNDLGDTNIKIIALCRSQAKADERFGEYYGRKDFELLVCDIQEEILVEQPIDFIIHTASPAGLVNSNKDPVETFKVNVWGADNLLRLAEKKQAEFLLFSSVDIYGKMGNSRFVESELGHLDTTDIRNVYAYGKRAAENLAVCYMSRGVTIKIVRPTQIMGGGIDLADGRIHIDFISQLIKNRKIVLKGDGTPIRSFIYMTDAITGILTVMTKGENGNAYNICNEDAEASVLAFAQIMADSCKEKAEIAFNYETRKKDKEVLHAVSVVTASSEKLRGLGWRPKVSIAEACRKMLAYYDVETTEQNR